MILNEKILKVLNKEKVSLSKEDIFKLSNNRMLFYTLRSSKKDKLTNYYFRIGKHWINKLKKTLIFLDSFFRKHHISYLIVKTYKHIPYVTFDVDVLVKERDFIKSITLFKNQHFDLGKHPGKQSLKQINLFKNGFLTIDLHKGFFWQGKQFFDEQLAWVKTRSAKISDINVSIPNNFIEVLLNLAHILHERRYITYLDYFFLIKELKTIDKTGLLKQADKYAWGSSLRDLLSIIDFIKVNYGSINFPYMLPFRLSLKTFTERYKKTRYFPKFDFFYFLFTTLRYYITNKKRLPYYNHWFRGVIK